MKKLTLILSCLLFMISCADRGTSEQERILKHVVIEYTRLLSEGYGTLNMTGLLAVATEERARKAYYHMAALGEGRIRMEAKRTDIDFIAVQELSKEEAEVKSVENWTYRHVNIDTENVATSRSVRYELTYRLIKRDGKWLVADSTIDNEESLSQ